MDEYSFEFCKYKPCSVSFIPNQHNQDYCGTECRRLAGNQRARDHHKFKMSVRKGNSNHRKCQRVMEDSSPLHPVRCGKPVKKGNHYLCEDCWRESESETQAMGYEL